ncbi:hypothetical protein F5888DRAFT_1805313 [Russula emetica]|nr:hypothetical protein F5888DRAFT_1805313 [Russula emetica]
MRRYMTFAQIFLILSIINFARAAPVVVRRVHEVHVNVVDVAEDETARSQRRWDSGPRDDWLADAEDQTSAQMTLRLADLDHSGLHSPRSNNEPSSSALSTGPHPRSSSSSGSSPILPGPDQSLNSDFSWPSQLEANNPCPASPDFSWPDHLPADNSLTPSPDYSPPTGPHQSAVVHPLSSSESPRPTEPETKDFLSQLNPSQDPPSPAEPETKDFLSQLHMSQDPPSPAEPETKDFISQLDPGPSHLAGSETKDFLSLFFKDKIKCRTSGSSAVDSVQKSESQATIDPGSYVFTSSPSPETCQPSNHPRTLENF